jgi:hypothetical protein
MSVDIRSTEGKGPGRPATGQDPVTAIRLSNGLRGAVDEWRLGQSDHPSRSEAIRRLIERGLGTSEHEKPGFRRP